jgi:hypothetical protein
MQYVAKCRRTLVSMLLLTANLERQFAETT